MKENPQPQRQRERREISLPAGISQKNPPEDDEEFPMTWEYSLLITSAGGQAYPIMLLPLGDRRLEGLISRLEEEGAIEANPVIPVVGYQAWAILTKDILKTLVLISSASREDRKAVVDYIKDGDFPCHILLNF